MSQVRQPNQRIDVLGVVDVGRDSWQAQVVHDELEIGMARGDAADLGELVGCIDHDRHIARSATRHWLSQNRATALHVIKASIEGIARWKKDPAFVKEVTKKYLKQDEALGRRLATMPTR